MNQKTRSIFMLLAGCYLMFTGGMLVRETLRGEPSNQTLFLALGVCFAVFGLIIAAAYLRSFLQYWSALWQARKEEAYEEGDDAEAEEILQQRPERAASPRKARAAKAAVQPEESVPAKGEEKSQPEGPARRAAGQAAGRKGKKKKKSQSGELFRQIGDRPTDASAGQDKAVRPADAPAGQDKAVRPADASAGQDKIGRSADASAGQDKASRPADASAGQDKTVRPADASADQDKASRQGGEPVKRDQTKRSKDAPSAQAETRRREDTFVSWNGRSREAGEPAERDQRNRVADASAERDGVSHAADEPAERDQRSHVADEPRRSSNRSAGPANNKKKRRQPRGGYETEGLGGQSGAEEPVRRERSDRGAQVRPESEAAESAEPIRMEDWKLRIQPKRRPAPAEEEEALGPEEPAQRVEIHLGGRRERRPETDAEQAEPAGERESGNENGQE